MATAYYDFGAGNMYVIPKADLAGNPITNGTPTKLGTLQDVTITLSNEIKTLYGAYQHPVAAGRGKAKTEISAKSGEFNPQLWTALIFGVIPTLVNNTTLEVAVTAPANGIVTITPPNSGTLGADLGVTGLATGLIYQKVASAPTVGQYSQSGNTYTFNATEMAGGQVKLNIAYQYTSTSTTAQSFDNNNTLMGYQPSCAVYFSKSYGGKATTIYFPNVVSNDFNLAMKNDDFTIPDIKLTALADASGLPYRISTT